MKERTSNLSMMALIAAIMSIITVFGGVTVFLGIFFALFGILAGSRGKRYQPTRLADWAVILSVLGFILCIAITVIFVALYLYGALGAGLDLLDIDFRYYYEALKDKIYQFIQQYI